ncbi:MAG TPA: hypothetical protein VME41_11690 [Stellaceae bacterium]|nr:hypothetical protein [Stellaceae bacterium]
MLFALFLLILPSTPSHAQSQADWERVCENTAALAQALHQKQLNGDSEDEAIDEVSAALHTGSPSDIKMDAMVRSLATRLYLSWEGTTALIFKMWTAPE